MKTATAPGRRAEPCSSGGLFATRLWAAALIALLLAVSVSGAEAIRVRHWAKPDVPDVVPGEVIVKFKRGVEKATVEAVHRRHGTAEIYTSKFGGFTRVRIPPGKAIAEMVAALSEEPSVEYAEPNSVCYAVGFPDDAPPNDPYYPLQWHLSNGVYGGIDVAPAWRLSQGAGAIVAVIDTGVAYETIGAYQRAPDLANTSFVAGYDFVGGDTHPNDDDGHGTHVTGTIAQITNNALGVAGVAFGCSIMPIKVLNRRGTGTAATVADGIRFAADSNAKVINMSLGWPVTNGVAYDPGQTVRDAVAYAYGKGVTIVCASGNDGQSAVAYPAAYDGYCIAVGATRYDETMPAYSNYGASLDLAAPGGDLGVDQNGDGYGDGVLQNTFDRNPKDWGCFFYQGTSMAAPHVSGVAALIIALGVTAPDDVRAILQSTAKDLGPTGWDAQYGHGRVNAAAAVQAAIAARRPVASDDGYTVAEDVQLSVAAPGVLANDRGNAPLTAILVGDVSHGTLALNADGSFTYTPSQDFNGQDQFTYQAYDGTYYSGTATVTITVSPVNDPPVAQPDTYSVAADGDLNKAAPGVLANDSDVEGSPITAVLVSGAGHGSVTLSANGSFRYTPTIGFAGSDSFTYRAYDGSAFSGDTTVTLNVLSAYAYQMPNAELMSAQFGKLTGYSGSSSTLDGRESVARGVIYTMTLAGDEQGKIGFGEPSWPLDPVAGLDPDPGVPGGCQPHPNSSLAAYNRYEMVVTYLDGPPGTTVNVGLFLNTGLTGPSGYPPNEWRNDTWWGSTWATLAVGESKILTLYLSDAEAWNIFDNPVPHTGGGQTWPDGGWYAVNDRDRHEISNIGVQVADFDGDALGSQIKILFNDAAPTAAQVQVRGARVEGGRVVVEWETASEVGTAGFCVTRRDAAGGKPITIGQSLLPGLLHRPQGGTYRVTDADVVEGQTYTYEIMEIEANGRKRACGACQVTVDKLATANGGGARPGHEPEQEAYSSTPHARPAPGVVGDPARGGRGAEARQTRPRAAGHAVKVAVRDDGLYYLAAEDLAPLLAGSAQSVAKLIEVGHLSLTCQGESVAYLPARGGAGLYFYGQAIASTYAAENVYWLDFGLGERMAEVRQSGVQPAPPGQTFTEDAHAEENRYPATGIFSDPDGDFWLWDYVVAGKGAKSFTLRADGAALAGRAALTVHLKGATSTRAARDHHARISLNGMAVGEARWDAFDAHALTMPVDAALVLPGANAVTVEGLLDTGAPYSIFYVNSFDLTYPRRYMAVGDCLHCRTAAHDVVTVEGFTQGDILVLDVTSPRRPRAIVGATVDDAEGTCRVSFASPGPDAACLVATPLAARRPAWLLSDVPSQLRHRSNRADYVIIAPAELGEAAQALAHYRSGQGIATMVVDLEDIYDEFNHGIPDPRAIQAFLAYAGSRWRVAPRFVLLAGRGTYDYKNYLGCDDNLVPVLLKGTADGLFVSDRQLAPGLAIGRLPATSASELRTLVQKTIAYEGSSGGWTKRVLMAADDADGGGNFPQDSDELARGIPAGYAVSKAYLSSAPLGQVRQQLLQGFSTGALLVNYIGHGGMDRLAQEGLLTIGDARSPNNGERLPIVVTLTCVAGRFDVPGCPCLGEALVKQPAGGAVAFWGPSGLLLNGQSKALGQRFLQAALGQGKRLLGQVAIESRADAASGESLDLYNLLGDPALRLAPAD